MKDLLAAGRYAAALYELASAMQKTGEIEAELEVFSQVLKGSAELEKFFANPQLSAAQKRQLLTRIYQGKQHEIYGTLLNFFTVLFEKHRFHLIHEIVASFRRIADEAEGQGVIEIRTAVPLDATAEAAIVSRLEKIAGHRVTAKKQVDPALIGGVVVRLKNKIWDGSVKHQIDLLYKELTKIQTA